MHHILYFPSEKESKNMKEVCVGLGIDGLRFIILITQFQSWASTLMGIPDCCQCTRYDGTASMDAKQKDLENIPLCF